MEDPFDSWLAERPKDDAPPEGELLKGTSFDGYRIVALLGRGGFAEVYRGEDENGQPVAIKILHKLDEKSRKRFARESRILAQVRHLNMPTSFGSGSCGNRPYLVTELLTDFELPCGDGEIAKFLKKIIGAAEALHRNGFVHRDIKPSNILRRKDGEPVLIDFGLACPMEKTKREQDGLSLEGSTPVAVGTPGYSAPEQFNGTATDGKADVHAIGVLIGKCFAGRKMPGCWHRIYLRATSSNPDARYPSVAELRRAIGRRHWLKIGGGLLVGCVLTVIACLIWEIARDRPDAAPLRQQRPKRQHFGVEVGVSRDT